MSKQTSGELYLEMTRARFAYDFHVKWCTKCFHGPASNCKARLELELNLHEAASKFERGAFGPVKALK